MAWYGNCDWWPHWGGHHLYSRAEALALAGCYDYMKDDWVDKVFVMDFAGPTLLQYFSEMKINDHDYIIYITLIDICVHMD